MENDDGFIQICSPIKIELKELAEILGLASNTVIPPRVLAKSSTKHKLNKKWDCNAIEIQYNLCKPCLVTFNEHFRTHEGLELLYVCNLVLEKGEQIAVAPSPTLFVSVRSNLTKIKPIATSLKTETGKAIDLSGCYSNIYLCLREHS